MGIHRYKGNKQHTFRKHNENCSWCGKYIISGHKIVFHSEIYGVHGIETDYCSPKCLSDDNRFSVDYFEKRVLMFLELGGEKEYIELQKELQEQKKIENENWRIEQSIKEKERKEKERRELTIKILMYVIGCGTAAIVMINLLYK